MDQTLREESGSQTQTSEPASSDAVAKLAYDLWLSRGYPHGSPEEDWYEAERILKHNVDHVETSPSEEISPEPTSQKSKAMAAGSYIAA